MYLKNLFSGIEPTRLCEVNALRYYITGRHIACVSAWHDNEELAWFLYGPGECDSVFKQPSGGHHSTVRGQPSVMILTFSHGTGQQALHGCPESIALTGWHPIPHLVCAGMQVLNPRQSMRVLVPAACREYHTHVYSGHSHAHHWAQRLEHRHRVVSKYFQVPWMFGERGRLCCWEPITFGSRID